jgi:epoxyqueuosine reductase
LVHSEADLKSAIRAEARRIGFSACGFARADSIQEPGRDLGRWIAEGRHGLMGWMEQRADQRSDPRCLWPEAKSVIAIGMSYAPAVDPLALADRGDAGRISIYARGGDYHKTVKKGLKALARWLVAEAGGELKVFVDTAPVMEKPLAQAAGIGWQGKHTNLLNREDGNWLFLGIILTTLGIDPDPPSHPGQHCGSCTRCLSACPTDAFDGPHRIDARRCISYLTIEHPGPIPEEFRTAIGNRIYGCDDCLAVCPWNRFADAAAANIAFHSCPGFDAPALSDLLALDDARFRTMFAGSPIKRIGVARMLRNCLIAAGNSGDPSLRPHAERHCASDDPVIADAARWALAQLAEA